MRKSPAPDRSSRRRLRESIGVVCLAVLASPPVQVQAACDVCTTFAPGTPWGVLAINPLQEASGLAASRRNPGVLWTHNDGSGQNLYAIGTNGVRLATLDLNADVDDLEDLAAGPGPVPGVSYLYLGDIGGSGRPGEVRPDVTIIRLPEPMIDPAWEANPRSLSADGAEVFTLNYPDGAFDAESLLVDPVSGEVLVVTKQPGSARWYRAQLDGIAPGASVVMEFVRAVAFGAASAGDISADGTGIILRRENFAMLWERCDDEPIGTALSRAGVALPVVGPPTEPNGEAIALLTDGTGYVTISEGDAPVLYYFQAQCPAAPRLLLFPADQSVLAGAEARLQAQAVGYPSPAYQWRHEGQDLPGENGATLTLPGVSAAQSGTYEVLASNPHGSVSATAVLTVRPKPDLRITEVMSSPASGAAPRADWWELTSFESQPVNLAGWRFNDSIGGLADPFVLPAGTSIGPGETIVLVETLTPTEFRAWWGAANLPAGLQIIRYSGNGLSFSASGDQLTLWDATVADVANFVARAVFGGATSGVSFNYDPVTGAFGSASQAGVNGAFFAPGGADLGSPGVILAPLVQPTLTIEVFGPDVVIDFQGAAGRVYLLEALSNPESGAWEPTGDQIEMTQDGLERFQIRRDFNRRYFRVLAR